MTYFWILRHYPCDPYMTHVRQCGTPSCATSTQERTGYIVVMHFSLNILRHHPCDQYMTHNGKFVVPLAARPAPKRVPATLFFILAIHTWHLSDNVVPLAARQAPKSVPDTWLLCTYPGILTNLYISPGFKDDTCETMWYPQLRDKRPRAYRLQLPSAAHSRAQKHSHVMEHTGYIALPSAAHSGAQKHSHVMVPLAARQAPKSIPATLRCPQLRTAAPRSTAMSWYP